MAQERGVMNRVSDALMGFSAGVRGDLPAFLQQRQAEEEARRKQALAAAQKQQLGEYQSNRIMIDMLEQGNVGAVKQALEQKALTMRSQGQDPGPVISQLKALQSGQLLPLLQQQDRNAVIQGGLKQRPQDTIEGQRLELERKKAQDADRMARAKNRMARGVATEAAKVEREKLTQKETDQKLRAEEARIAREEFEFKKTRLTPGLEKQMLGAQDIVTESQRLAQDYEGLADEFERLNVSGGLASTVSESLKGLLGTQDAVSDLRRQFNKARLKEGLNLLPPGPATDRDVAEAFKGVPPENAPASQVSTWLRGAAKIEAGRAAWNQFKSDFISDKRTGQGLNQAWRKKVRSEKLGRDVTMQEIYYTAQRRGVPPEEVMQQLGIQ